MCSCGTWYGSCDEATRVLGPSPRVFKLLPTSCSLIHCFSQLQMFSQPDSWFQSPIRPIFRCPIGTIIFPAGEPPANSSPKSRLFLRLEYTSELLRPLKFPKPRRVIGELIHHSHLSLPLLALPGWRLFVLEWRHPREQCVLERWRPHGLRWGGVVFEGWGYARMIRSR